jgi:hypothetical protein
MNKPVYDNSYMVIGHILDGRAVTLVQDRGGKTSFFYNKTSDKTFDMNRQLLGEGDRALELLKSGITFEAAALNSLGGFSDSVERHFHS